MAGLLDYVSSIAGEAKNYASSVAGEAKKNVQGLLADPKQQLMKTLNNLTAGVAASQAKTKAAWATHDPDIIAQDALDGLQTALSFAPLGITAWHGSPHKFNKFSLDKIGTGEGAQAYGHGLYLAEMPEVAQKYQQFGSWAHRANGQGQPVFFKGQPVQFNSVGNVAGEYPGSLKSFLSRVASKGDYDVALNEAKQALSELKASNQFPSVQNDLAQEIQAALSNKAHIQASGATGHLYKTDIPDEAVARFMDWDKPLSQQSKEVRAAMAKFYGVGADDFAKMMRLDPDKFDKSGQQLINDLAGRLNARNLSPLSGNTQASNYLKDAGIPGIRYLDGGSRGAGQGSSNFVVFDPELIRILERNGQATGNIPWQPGEWRGLLGNN